MSAYIGILRTKIISLCVCVCVCVCVSEGGRYKGVRLKRISKDSLVLNLIWKFEYDS